MQLFEICRFRWFLSLTWSLLRHNSCDTCKGKEASFRNWNKHQLVIAFSCTASSPGRQVAKQFKANKAPFGHDTKTTLHHTQLTPDTKTEDPDTANINFVWRNRNRPQRFFLGKTRRVFFLLIAVPVSSNANLLCSEWLDTMVSERPYFRMWFSPWCSWSWCCPLGLWWTPRPCCSPSTRTLWSSAAAASLHQKSIFNFTSRFILATEHSIVHCWFVHHSEHIFRTVSYFRTW